ncbi:hypothetical protein J2T12_001447 [Paenibacillus anaericanus]|nr:hypothetical protein [Paenibacillus anaericanus]
MHLTIGRCALYGRNLDDVENGDLIHTADEDDGKRDE